MSCKTIFVILFNLLFVSLTLQAVISLDSTDVHDDKFYYFGYGSNMLAKRIRIQNPTSVKIGASKLNDYRLDFNTYTERWDGAPATIVPTKNATVYGTLWEIDITNLNDIDNQEGVHDGIYTPVSVTVSLSNGTDVVARAYTLVEQPSTDLRYYDLGSVPLERQPSKTYLQCLVKGAMETGIDLWYVNWLKSLKHNGHVAKEFEYILELEDVEVFN